MRRLVRLIAAGASAASPAFAHDAGSAMPWQSDWLKEPLIEIMIGMGLTWYGVGLVQMLTRHHQKWPVGKGRVAAFIGGLATVAVALLSPLDALADRLFSVHMAQHLLLMMGAAPLLAVSNAHLVLIRALPLSARRAFGRAVAAIPGVAQAATKETAAWIAAGVFVATLWFWHIPAAYDWALRDEVVHSVEHLMLLIASCFFWRIILTSGDRRLSFGMAAMLVSLVGIQGALLSALIMFAPYPLYTFYAANPIDDQVLAGILMCIPASFVYFASTIWALSRMLGNRHGTRSRVHAGE